MTELTGENEGQFVVVFLLNPAGGVHGDFLKETKKIDHIAYADQQL